MKRGTTSTGFAYEFDETKLDDMRFFEQLADIVDDEATETGVFVALNRIVKLLFSKEEKDRLYQHITQQNDGRVPPKEVEREILEIINGAGGKDAVKN